MHRVCHMAAWCRRANAGGPSTPCMFFFYYSTKPFKSGRGTFKHLSVMDAACKVSKKLGVTHRGSKLQGRPQNGRWETDGCRRNLTYCKPEGCSYYRLIRFIVAPCAEEILVSYKD